MATIEQIKHSMEQARLKLSEKTDLGPDDLNHVPLTETVALRNEQPANAVNLNPDAGNVEAQGTESWVAETMAKEPHAKSKVIGKQIGGSANKVRTTNAWRENRAQLEQQKAQRSVRTKPLTTKLANVIDSKSDDPAEITAEREESEMTGRAARDDTDAVSDPKMLQHKYLEGATANQRARYHMLSA
jgi:hypothetical protein